MSDAAETDTGPFGPRAAASLIGVVVFAFLAIVAMLGWSPEIARRDHAGQHAYSRSATGYAGFLELMEARGWNVEASRVERRLEEGDGALLVVAPGLSVTRNEFGGADLAQPVLIVLPKWRTNVDPLNRGFDGTADLRSTDYAAGPLAPFDPDAELWRIRSPARLATPFGEASPALGENMQVLRSDRFEPVVATPGGALVAKWRDGDVYVLSDPDLINTHGLADLDNARLAVALMEWLDGQTFGYREIVFDATLQGFIRSENLLQLLFDVPLLGGTLAALAAAGLLAWAAAVRFGATEREARAIALGKTALADNTAGLVAIARRETRLAPAYAALSRRAAAAALGAPKTIDRDAAARLFNKARPSQDAPDWGALEAALDTPPPSREQLVRHARALHARRKEMARADR